MVKDAVVEQNKDRYEDIVALMNNYLSSVNGSSFSICAELYEWIQQGEKAIQPRLFEKAILLYEDIELDETREPVSSPYEKNKEALKEQYGELVNSFIDFFVQQKYSCELFYKNLWDTLQSDVFFADNAAKLFAFYYVVIDRRVPYFELPQGYQMTNESFRNLYKKLSEETRKIRYILSTEMKQKTERSSLLLQELGIAMPGGEASVEVITDYERKLMIMVEIINHGNRRSATSVGKLMEVLQERIAE